MRTAKRRDGMPPRRLPALLLVTGTDAFTTQLVLRAATSPHEKQVRSVRDPISVTTSGRVRAVTTQLDHVDQIALEQGGRWSRVSGEGHPVTANATVSGRGWLYWAEADWSAEPVRSRLRRHERGTTVTIYETAQTVTHVAIAGGRDQPTLSLHGELGSRALLLDTNGKELRSTPLPRAGVSAFVGSERHSLLAISYGPDEPGELLNVHTAESLPLPVGWRPLSWTRDGRFCLLAQLEELHLLDARTGARHGLPSASLPVFAGAWLPRSRRSPLQGVNRRSGLVPSAKHMF